MYLCVIRIYFRSYYICTQILLMEVEMLLAFGSRLLNLGKLARWNYNQELLTAMVQDIFACKIPRTRRCRRLSKKSKPIHDDDEKPKQTNAGVWLLLLQYDTYAAAASLSYIITPTIWSILNAVNKETKQFLSTHPKVWQGVDIDLTQFNIPGYSCLMDDLFKYAKSVTIMQDQASTYYRNQNNLRLRCDDESGFFISELPLIRKLRYEVEVYNDQFFNFSIGIVDNETYYDQGTECISIVVHSKLPQEMMWKVNDVTVQSINPQKVLGMDSEQEFMRKEPAIVGIEVHETSINFIWNGRHIDSMSASFISKVFNDKFRFFYDGDSDIYPFDAFLNTTI